MSGKAARSRAERDAPSQPVPTRQVLAEAAAAYLARYSASQRGLRDVLIRRIERWRAFATNNGAASDDAEQIAAQARSDAEAVVAKLVGAGALDDAQFAEQRARSLRQSGRSRRAISARLMAKGIDATQARDAAGDDGEAELAACLVLLRRRRLGPYAADGGAAIETDEDGNEIGKRHKVLAMLARAGFAADVARRALAMDREEAEDRIIALRRT